MTNSTPDSNNDHRNKPTPSDSSKTDPQIEVPTQSGSGRLLNTAAWFLAIVLILIVGLTQDVSINSTVYTLGFLLVILWSVLVNLNGYTWMSRIGVISGAICLVFIDGGLQALSAAILILAVMVMIPKAFKRADGKRVYGKGVSFSNWLLPSSPSDDAVSATGLGGVFIVLLFAGAFVACGGPAPTINSLFADSAKSVADQQSATSKIKFSASSVTPNGKQNLNLNLTATANLDNPFSSEIVVDDDTTLTIVDNQLYITGSKGSVELPGEQVSQQTGLNTQALKAVNSYYQQIDETLTGDSSDTRASSGPSVNGQETWSVKFDFADVDYRKLTDLYAGLFSATNNITTPNESEADKKAAQQLSQQVAQAIKSISNSDLNDLKKILSTVEMEWLFTKSSALPVSIQLKAAWDSDVLKILDSNTKSGSQVTVNLQAITEYSKDQVSIEKPESAAKLNSKAGKQALSGAGEIGSSLLQLSAAN
jgi:hypothetical protein